MCHIVDGGVTGLTHISRESDPELLDELFGLYDVNAVPTFVVINDDGESRVQSGWSERALTDDINWITES